MTKPVTTKKEYRLKLKYGASGTLYYQVQRKGLVFWKNISYWSDFQDRVKAEEFAKKDAEDTSKNFIYLGGLP